MTTARISSPDAIHGTDSASNCKYNQSTTTIASSPSPSSPTTTASSSTATPSVIEDHAQATRRQFAMESTTATTTQHRCSRASTTTTTSTSLPSNEYVLNVAFVSFVAFTVLEAVFAAVAHSQSMMADAAAMGVDAMTYLLNMCSERIKRRPITDDHRSMFRGDKNSNQQEHIKLVFSYGEQATLHYRYEMRILVLELLAPSVSVVTLMVVTVLTLREAWNTLQVERIQNQSEDANYTEAPSTPEVSIPIMLGFSAANLILDVINVVCFVRAQSTFGLGMVRQEQSSIVHGWEHDRQQHAGGDVGTSPNPQHQHSHPPLFASSSPTLAFGFPTHYPHPHSASQHMLHHDPSLKPTTGPDQGDFKTLLLFQSDYGSCGATGPATSAPESKPLSLDTIHVESSNGIQDEIDNPLLGQNSLSEATAPVIYRLDTAVIDMEQVLQSHRRHPFINLNMCSAWTHVCADTMRSAAVLVASASSCMIPALDGDVADSSAAIAISVIILISLIPLLQGLVLTALQIVHVRRHYRELLASAGGR